MFEPDLQCALFWEHYLRLKEMKKKYDPHTLPVVIEGIGSEVWETELRRRI